MQPHVSDHKQEYNYDNSHVCALTCGVKVHTDTHTHPPDCARTCTRMFCVSQEWLVNVKKHTFYGMKLPTGFQLIGKVVQRFFFFRSVFVRCRVLVSHYKKI